MIERSIETVSLESTNYEPIPVDQLTLPQALETIQILGAELKAMYERLKDTRSRVAS